MTRRRKNEKRKSADWRCNITERDLSRRNINAKRGIRRRMKHFPSCSNKVAAQMPKQIFDF